MNPFVRCSTANASGPGISAVSRGLFRQQAYFVTSKTLAHAEPRCVETHVACGHIARYDLRGGVERHVAELAGECTLPYAGMRGERDLVAIGTAIDGRGVADTLRATLLPRSRTIWLSAG